MPSRVALVLVILAILFAAGRGTVSSKTSDERLRAIDGDTLQIDGTVVQLYGIDAPELGQLCESNGRLWHCGMEAARGLSKLVALNQSSLHCTPWSNGRESAPDPPAASALQVCKVGDQDLAVLLLHSGLALALPGAFPDYLDAEQQAREARLGIWHSDFVAPWDWRAGIRSPSRPSDSTRECTIKGVSAHGQRLYYVPTDPEYQAIIIDPGQGDEMFCSDDEARQGGWRRSGEPAGVAP
jgi:endonuclease YncB( thermonuclease family)